MVEIKSSGLESPEKQEMKEGKKTEVKPKTRYQKPEHPGPPAMDLVLLAPISLFVINVRYE